MSYQKQNFVDGQTLTAAHLNHMEAGIAAAATGVKGDKGDPGPAGAKGEKGDSGEGFTANARALLLNLFENAAYKTDTMQPTLNALRAEWDGSVQDIPVQSISLSSSTLTLNEGESKTLTATVLPANATSRMVVWTVTPTGFATVSNGVVTGIKAGSCTVTAMAGGKSASCTVTVEAAETAQLIYTMTAETELTNGFDTGLKLLEHASTESPQYTILLDAKAGDNFDASTWPDFLHCLTETGINDNLPGFVSGTSPHNNKTELSYYNYSGVTLSDSIEHLKTRTRYVVQLDGRKFRGGSTYCPLTEWKITNGTIIDVPQTFLIGAAQSADGSKKQQFWTGTLYQCKVYKGLLSDEKVNEFINSSGSDSGSDKIPVQSISLSSSTLTLNEGESKTLTATVLPANATNKTVTWGASPTGFVTVANGVVTGSKAGTCTVTATAGGKSAQCVVTVAASVVEDVPGETPVYKLAAPKTFVPANMEYIDTGIRMFESIDPKPEYTILFEAQCGENVTANSDTWVLMHCMEEIAPWPGFTVQIVGSGGDSGLLQSNVYGGVGTLRLLSVIKETKQKLAITISENAAVFWQTKDYKDTSEISNYDTTVNKSLILGAYQTSDGTKGRFFDGTLYQCLVYNKKLTDEQIYAWLAG